MFQFQSGTVKSLMTKGLFIKFFMSFNSKVVRLKVNNVSGKLSVFASFNSKVVRLKELRNPPHNDVYGVSIPKWYG